MSTTPVYTDFAGLDRLRLKAQQAPKAALREVARQFEALFTQMMLKSMREANFGGGLLDSSAGDQYRDLLDHQFSLDFANGHGLGLADIIVRQLGGAGAGPATPAAAGPVPAAAPVPAKAPAEPAFDSPQAFVRGLWPLARKAGTQLGVDPAVLIAQSALETGWGQAVVRTADGQSSHNLFNIKADERWSGPAVSKPTLEYADGVAQRRRAAFRRYGSYAESFQDYVAFLRTSPRYAAALRQVGDARAFLGALQQAGYATDPDYARKVGEILGRPDLQDVLGQLKTAAAQPLTPTQES